MKLSTFGLDIGTTSIKVIALREDNTKVILDSIAVSPFTAKSILSESQVNLQAIASSIHEMISNAQINTKQVNVSIPASQVYTKIIEMPDLSVQDVTSALSWEMEQYVPLPLNQVRTDWQILERYEREGKRFMSILLVAASLAVLTKYEKILSLAGLVASTIETEMVSVHRALLPILAGNQPSLIIHLGSSTTNLAIVANGILKLVATTGLGGFAITRAISADLGIDINQAEDIKKNYGFEKDTFQGKIGQTLSPILNAIAEDVKRTIITYREKNANDTIKQVILSGGTSLLPGINDFFSKTLSLQVQIGNAFSAYKMENVPEEIMREAPSYNVVAGLALRDMTANLRKKDV